MKDGKVAIVTGTSSGFGRLIVETLARRGLTVFAGMRDPEGKNAASASELSALGAAEGLSIHVVPLDATHPNEAEAAAAIAMEKAGRIDVLVNNAGIGAFGVAETFTGEQLAELLQTNVVGPHTMNRAVLPWMRAAGSGLIVYISTSIAHAEMPFMGLYCASKAALEALAETTSYELNPLGIESVIVEASVYPTGIMSRMVHASDQARMSGYGPLFPVMEKVGAAQQYMLSTKPNPQDVADAVASLVETPAKTRPLRMLVGRIHPPGTQDLNDQIDKNIAAFYAMIGVTELLKPRE